MCFIHFCHRIFLFSFTIRSAWRKNRFIRGSYSFRSTNSAPDDQDVLREPYKPDGVRRVSFSEIFSSVYRRFQEFCLLVKPLINDFFRRFMALLKVDWKQLKRSLNSTNKKYTLKCLELKELYVNKFELFENKSNWIFVT